MSDPRHTYNCGAHGCLLPLTLPCLCDGDALACARGIMMGLILVTMLYPGMTWLFWQACSAMAKL